MQMIGEIPEHYLSEAFRILKINQTTVFKNFCSSCTRKNVCREFLFTMFGADRATIAFLYSKIEMALIVGGCAPGLGIAFNLIDASFCFMLQNWLGFVIAILSCFPIPGFKAAGKGLEKLLTQAIKRIPIGQLSSNFTRLLGKRMDLLKNFVNKKPYVTIQKAVSEYITDINNPFSEEVFRQLQKIIKTYGPRLEEKSISATTHMQSMPGLTEILKRRANLIQ